MERASDFDLPSAIASQRRSEEKDGQGENLETKHANGQGPSRVSRHGRIMASPEVKAGPHPLQNELAYPNTPNPS